MVCVTTQKNCQRLIDYGGKRKTADDNLYVIHVARGDACVLGSSEEGEILQFLYEKAREAGASLQVEKSDDVLGTLMDIVEKKQITEIICGESGEHDGRKCFLGDFEKRLKGKAKLTVLPSVS